MSCRVIRARSPHPRRKRLPPMAPARLQDREAPGAAMGCRGRVLLQVRAGRLICGGSLCVGSDAGRTSVRCRPRRRDSFILHNYHYAILNLVDHKAASTDTGGFFIAYARPITPLDKPCRIRLLGQGLQRKNTVQKAAANTPNNPRLAPRSTPDTSMDRCSFATARAGDRSLQTNAVPDPQETSAAAPAHAARRSWRIDARTRSCSVANGHGGPKKCPGRGPVAIQNEPSRALT